MTRNELAQAKDEYIARRQKALRRNVSAIEAKIYAAIFDEVVKRLGVADGRVLSTAENKRLIARIDKIIEKAAGKQLAQIGAVVASDLSGIASANSRYFETVADVGKKQIAETRQAAQKALQRSLGLTEDNTIKSGAYLDRLLTTEPLQKSVKKTLLKGLTANVPIEKLKANLSDVVKGNANVDGKLTRYFDQAVSDTYNQYDRLIGQQFAKWLGLNAFIYAGGTIATTRCFCRERNGKVFTKDEADTWRNDLGGECSPQWNEDESGQYIPTIHLGGYNCRHSADWISDREAIRRRPELKEILKPGD